MKKKLGVIILAILAVSFAGFSVKNIMNNNNTEQQMINDLKKPKEQITEIFKWNYNVDSVTFAWNESPDNGLVKNDNVPELATSPMGSVTLLGYVNDNKKASFSYGLNSENFKIDKLRSYSNDIKSLLKNPNPTSNKISAPENYYLQYDDIQELKKQGYTSDITFEQIKQYFDNKNVAKED